MYNPEQKRNNNFINKSAFDEEGKIQNDCQIKSLLELKDDKGFAFCKAQGSCKKYCYRIKPRLKSESDLNKNYF